MAKKNINDALKPGDIKEGIGVLAREEWLQLQAFTQSAIYDNPTTDELMRVKMKLDAKAPLEQDFKDTVKLYADLKTYCTTFDNEIKPGTLELASDIVQYERRVRVIYRNLIKLLVDYGIDGKVSELKLKELADEWKKDHPSSAATTIKETFQDYIGKLKKEAETRSGKATALQGKLTGFHNDLKKSKSDFGAHYTNYETKYGTANTELDKVNKELEDLEEELKRARKKHHDETLF